LALASYNIINIVIGSYFEHNTAGEAGGAIHSSLGNSGFFVSRSEFWENTASASGGAVHLGTDHDNVTLSKVLIQHCHAQEGGGVYIGHLNTRITVSNTSMHHNEVIKKTVQ
jgi:hypothetical protein